MLCDLEEKKDYKPSSLSLFINGYLIVNYMFNMHELGFLQDDKFMQAKQVCNQTYYGRDIASHMVVTMRKKNMFLLFKNLTTNLFVKSKGYDICTF